MAQGGRSADGTRRGGLAVCTPGARPGPAAEGSRGRSPYTLPAWRGPSPRRPSEDGAGRSLLPAGPGPGRGARYAPAPGALPPRPRHAVWHDRPARAGPHRVIYGHRNVPGHGDDPLAPTDRSGAGAGGGAVMDYDAVLAQVVTLLQQEQRVAYRILKRRLQLDDETLEDLKADLIYAKKLAVDEEGQVLVW